jgi:hypothetical protein
MKPRRSTTRRNTHQYRRHMVDAFINTPLAEGDSTEGLPPWLANLPYWLRLLFAVIVLLVCTGVSLYLLWAITNIW